MKDAPVIQPAFLVSKRSPTISKMERHGARRVSGRQQHTACLGPCLLPRRSGGWTPVWSGGWTPSVACGGARRGCGNRRGLPWRRRRTARCTRGARPPGGGVRVRLRLR
eukprot:scaffold8805_cov23-Phaeocystis_antarctica.AAC.3